MVSNSSGSVHVNPRSSVCKPYTSLKTSLPVIIFIVITTLGNPFFPAPGTIPALGCTQLRLFSSKRRVGVSSERWYFGFFLILRSGFAFTGKYNNEIPPARDKFKNFLLPISIAD
ncbi:MAG TPA: hypothetical protein PL067_05195, partial [Bacteroidales bacterium]|nr:hypothetical protein [Bacteroidales bacterium]